MIHKNVSEKWKKVKVKDDTKHHVNNISLSELLRCKDKERQFRHTTIYLRWSSLHIFCWGSFFDFWLIAFLSSQKWKDMQELSYLTA